MWRSRGRPARARSRATGPVPPPLAQAAAAPPPPPLSVLLEPWLQQTIAPLLEDRRGALPPPAQPPPPARSRCTLARLLVPPIFVASPFSLAAALANTAAPWCPAAFRIIAAAACFEGGWRPPSAPPSAPPSKCPYAALFFAPTVGRVWQQRALARPPPALLGGAAMAATGTTAHTSSWWPPACPRLPLPQPSPAAWQAPSRSTSACCHRCRPHRCYPLRSCWALGSARRGRRPSSWSTRPQLASLRGQARWGRPAAAGVRARRNRLPPRNLCRRPHTACRRHGPADRHRRPGQRAGSAYCCRVVGAASSRGHGGRS